MSGERSVRSRRVPVVLLSFLAILAGSTCATGAWRTVLGAPIVHVYDFTDETGLFEEMECPEKGRTFALVRSRFEEWKRRENRPDAVLHRTFEEEWEGFLGLAGPYEPWHSRWELPYRARSDGD